MASGDNQQKRVVCRAKNPCILIRKLIDLVEHPITAKETERHFQILQDFLSNTQYAFWLQDIPYIIRLYENIVKRLEQIPKFREPLKDLLQFSTLPPMIIKNSDQVNYARDLQEYFSTLGYLIVCLHETDYKLLVINAIRGLLTYDFPHNYCFLPLKNRKKAAEQSRLPEILAQLLQVVDEDIYPDLLDIMFRTCEISNLACEKMLPENAIEFLLQRLNPNWKDCNEDTKSISPSKQDHLPQFEDTCCILWKLLNVVNREKIKLAAPSKLSLWSLQYAFRWSNVSPGQKNNRNNIAAIITKILIIFPDISFTEDDIFDDMLFVTFELSGSDKLPLLLFSEADIDYQYRRIIFSCLLFYPEKKIQMTEISNEIITAFLRYLFDQHPDTKHHIEQCCQLARIIFKIIPKYVSSSNEAFSMLDGPTSIVTRIKYFLQNAYELELLQAYTSCLKNIMNIDPAIILTKIDGTWLTKILIAIEMIFDEIQLLHTLAPLDHLFGIVSKKAFPDISAKILERKTLSNLLQQLLSDFFQLFNSILKFGKLANKEIINLCINYLNRVIKPRENDPLFDSRVTICAIHLLWECIFAFKPFFREFLQKGGIYVMLDITEISTFTIKSISLGMLDDLSLKISSIPYLITWRKHGQRLIPLLLEIFRNRTEKNCDKQQVQLVNEHTETVWLKLCNKTTIKYDQKCVTQEELLKKCRARIQGILSALKERHKSNVELANEHYKLFNDKLSTDDELTMLFAENFQSLNMCQAWVDVAAEIKSEGIKLVQSDKDNLKERLETIKQWKAYLQMKIENIVKQEHQEEELKELETYNTLKQARLSDALDALKELRFVSNATERLFQMRQKLMLFREVDELEETRGRHFHKTISKLPFLNIYDQHVNIQSNVIYEKNNEERPISPVSLDGDESLQLEDDIEHNLSDYELNC